MGANEFGMLFSLVAAILTLCACLAVLLPVTRGRVAVAADAAHDLEVYRDQLRELERDAARGTIGPQEAEQARAEIGRRVLKAAAAEGATHRAGTKLTKVVATAAVLLVPLASWATYSMTGSPSLPAQPLQARLEGDAGQGSIAELVARAEGHLAANPQDGRGWDVLAPIYFRMGRFEDAEIAFANAIRLLGSTAQRETGHAEAIAAAAGGPVTTQAQAALERALALEPNHPQALYMLASGYAQEGRREEAVQTLERLQGSLDEGSPWAEPVRRALASLSSQPPAGASGPTQEDVDAAAALSEDDRRAMIDTMVASLDERLRANPQDLDGWQRLVHAYVVLGRTDDAGEALARGIEALGEASEAGQALAAFAAERGVHRKE